MRVEAGDGSGGVDRPGFRGRLAWIDAPGPLGLRDLLVLPVLGLFITILIGLGDTMSAAPSLVDDIQIFMLDRAMEDEGFAVVAQEHYADRIDRLGRFVPAYLTYKLIAVQLFGTQLGLWAVAGIGIGVAAAFFLYAAGRAMRLTTAEALYLSLITVLGEQSVVWWRLLQGEGLGILFLGMGLLFLALGAGARRRMGWDAAAVLCITLATLSKESFILVVPGVCFLRIWLETSWGRSVGESLKRNAFFCGVLLSVALAEILVIKFAIAKQDFWYTGWKGFDAKDFIGIAFEFFSGYRAWMLFSTMLLGLLLAMTARAFLPVAPPGIRRMYGRARGLLVLAVLIVLPQLLLYMSSGFFSGPETHDMSRYLLPATLGVGLVVGLSLGQMREWSAAFFSEGRAAEFGRYFRGLAHAAIVAPLVLQAVVAEVAADRFFDRRDDIGALLDAVADGTEPEDVILLAYNAKTAKNTRRLSILLEGYADRENLFYVPLRGKQSDGGNPVDWFEYDRYAERVEDRTCTEPSTLGFVKAFIIVDCADAEPAAVLQNASWFDPRRYERFRTECGHVVYLARSPSKAAERERLSMGGSAGTVRVDGAPRAANGGRLRAEAAGGDE